MRNLLRKSHKAFKRHAEILKSNSYIAHDGLIALEEITSSLRPKTPCFVVQFVSFIKEVVLIPRQEVKFDMYVCTLRSRAKRRL